MCKHYQRHCSIITPCCNKKYACRLCHDEEEYENQMDYKKSHQINRHAIEKIVCDNCNTEQPKSNECIKCKTIFGEYYCDICNFYDNDLSKGLFHCNKCGICRVGHQHNFIHCDKCGTCVGKKNHKCMVKDIKSDCPVCLDPIFDKRDNPHILECGHVLHTECFKKYIQTDYKCPMCKKSMYDINQYIEQQVNSVQMPEEYNMDVEVLCNDCNKQCMTKFHFMAMKCNHCGSYNTVRT